MFPTAKKLLETLYAANVKRLPAAAFNHAGDTPPHNDEYFQPMLDIHLNDARETFLSALELMEAQGIGIPTYFCLRRFLDDLEPSEEEAFFPHTVRPWFYIHLTQFIPPNRPSRPTHDTTGSAVLWWLAACPSLLRKYQNHPIILDGYSVEDQTPALVFSQDRVDLRLYPRHIEGRESLWPENHRLVVCPF